MGTLTEVSEVLAVGTWGFASWAVSGPRPKAFQKIRQVRIRRTAERGHVAWGQRSSCQTGARLLLGKIPTRSDSVPKTRMWTQSSEKTCRGQGSGHFHAAWPHESGGVPPSKPLGRQQGHRGRPTSAVHKVTQHRELGYPRRTGGWFNILRPLLKVFRAGSLLLLYIPQQHRGRASGKVNPLSG